MSSDDNTIRITTDELSVSFSGPAGRVQQSYMSLRHVLLEAFETTMQQHDGGEEDASVDEAPAEAKAGNTMPMHASAASPPEETRETTDEAGDQEEEEGVDEGNDADDETNTDPGLSAAVRALTPDEPSPSGAVIQLVLRRENYTKVRLLERRELADSFLGEALDAAILHRVHTSPETADQLHDSLTIGDTLWRKLTPAGRREVARRSRAGTEESDD